MSGVEWLACADPEAVADVALAASSLGAGNKLEFVHDVDELRRRALDRPGTVWALVGCLSGGVSDVNAAAAIAADGCARSVSIVRRDASGSLRSRAARAGVDLVIDPSELGPASAPKVMCKELPEVAVLSEGLPRTPPTVGHVIPAPPTVKGRAPVIVFCSGRGGVGKTALAAATCVAASSWGMRVCALDLDLSCGNLYSCFGVPGAFDLTRLCEGEGTIRPETIGVAACERVRVAGPCERPELADIVMPRTSEIIASCASAFDLVVVDTSTTFTEASAQAAQLADRLLIVSGSGQGATASLARASGLAVRLGVARTRIARLENFADPRGRGASRLACAEVGLEAARQFAVVDGGEEVRELLCAGQAAQLLELGVPFAESAATMLAQVLAELGQLPECDAARRALDAGGTHKRSFFGRKREARSA